MRSVRFSLTASRDYHLLSRNQVNVLVAALAEILFGVEARLSRVSFFDMKWALSSAEPIIDHYMSRYRDQMGSSVPEVMNSFDYGYRIGTNEIVFFGLIEVLRLSHLYSDGRVHEMCDMEGFGSIRLTPSIDVRSAVEKFTRSCVTRYCAATNAGRHADTLRTMRTRATQLRSLIMG